MAGVKHDPLADISLISDNLRDRYKSGFPILKEIVQNADDAGAAQLSFGYSSGLPDAQHELLQGPAVFFINDGPFSEENSDGILSIALGSKASDENAIGKFGLGMKSLFHLCEAFFYLSNKWADGEEYHSNIFNPWGTLREPWEIFDQNDKQLIQNHLADAVEQIHAESKTSNWFIVWVPLRKRHSVYDGIIEYYPGDDGQAPDFILDGGIDVKLGQLLPLLKGLKSITIWQPNDGGLTSSTAIKLNENAIRRQFHNPVVDSTLQGKILLTKGNDKQQIDYAGYESLLPDELFKSVRDSEFWPKSYERNRTTGKEKKVEDKAKPHLAVVICQRKAIGRANCYSDWAVFLPLGSYPQNKSSYWVNPDDKYDTQVFIHGYFFIDAGRVHIHALDDIGKVIDAIDNSDHVRSQWNSILATQGCLSYLPQAVHNFVIAHNCGVERTQHLSEAIFKSDFVRQYRQWISSRFQWLYQLKPDGKAWQLISADSPVLALPPAPKDEQNRAWSVFPRLGALSEQGYIFYDQSQVHVLNERHKGWNDALLLDVLNIDVSSVFYGRTFCNYLNNFLSLEEVKKTEAVTEHLIRLARSALTLPSDKLVKVGVTRFLEFVPPGQCVVLYKVKMQGLWTRLAQVKTRFLIVPKEVAPEREETANLLLDDAKLLLQAVDQVLGNDTQINHHGEAQDLVEEILKRFEPNEKERLIQTCSDLRLFKVHDFSKKKDIFLAKSKLLSLSHANSLFRFQSASFGSSDRFGLGKELSEAIKSCNIFYIDSNNFNLAFGRQSNVSFCDARACLRSYSQIWCIENQAASCF